MQEMLRILPVDYQNPEHADALLKLLNHYAQDRWVAVKALSDDTKANLIAEMAKRPTVFSFIAWDDHAGAVGLINCVEGFLDVCPPPPAKPILQPA